MFLLKKIFENKSFFAWDKNICSVKENLKISLQFNYNLIPKDLGEKIL